MAKKEKHQGQGEPLVIDQPQFGEIQPLEPDPTVFKVQHPSDTEFYKEIDKKRLLAIPPPNNPDNLIMTLDKALGSDGIEKVKKITANKKIVFHACGDTGPTKSPHDIDGVVDKLVLDFNETDKSEIPSFCYHLGDVVYSFGESQYYYDQFYDPFRNYQAPIFAIAGNHDGLVYRTDKEAPLDAFKRNFLSEELVITPEAGGLRRSAMMQPSIYFTLDAPFITIIGLFSNVLEDPGVISSQDDEGSPVSDVQLDFLVKQLKKVKDDSKAVIVALHHPPYTSGSVHSASPKMLADLDACCKKADYWPHLFLSGHAHNYQRYTRTVDDKDVPYIVCGNSGHGLTRLRRGKNADPIRTPAKLSDELTFENYDDKNFGYLRIVADEKNLLVEYHDSDLDQKSPSDAVTVSIKKHTITYN